MNEENPVVVFGGTGFLGQRVVRALAKQGFPVRVAARRPHKIDFSDAGAVVEPVEVDVRDQGQVKRALTGSQAAVNAVSLFIEKGDLSFDAVHVDAAGSLAHCARQQGVDRLVHVSGLGVREDSPSRFISARARGETAVLSAFPTATIIRPSVMIGRGDAFLSSLKLATRMPVVPLFGDGSMRLQPAYVKDVARAAALLATETGHGGLVYELGGSEVYTYKEALSVTAQHFHRHNVLTSMPFAVWHLLVGAMALLPNPPLTKDQLMLMQEENTVHAEMPGFASLGIKPRNLQDVLAQISSS